MIQIPVGDIIYVVGVVVLGIIAVASLDAVTEVADDPPQSIGASDDSTENTKTPDIDYPGDDSTVAPKGYEWRGSGEQGSKEGSYYNPYTKSSLHPDLDHPDPIGPHWDYSGPEGKFRIFPDGKILPK